MSSMRNPVILFLVAALAAQTACAGGTAAVTVAGACSDACNKQES